MHSRTELEDEETMYCRKRVKYQNSACLLNTHNFLFLNKKAYNNSTAAKFPKDSTDYEDSLIGSFNCSQAKTFQNAFLRPRC